MSFTLFPMAGLCYVTTLELKSLFVMVNRIKYTLVDDTLSTTLKMFLKCQNPLSVPLWSPELP
jgi:hypothetical protein